MKNDRLSRGIVLAVCSIFGLGLLLQAEAIYSDYISPASSCLFGMVFPYMKRRIVQTLIFLGIGISSAVSYKLKWRLPSSKTYKIILCLPIILFVLDEIVFRLLTNF